MSRLPSLLLLPLLLLGCGDKDDDSGAAEGTDGSDGASDGTDGASDGTDGASDGTDGASDGTDGASDGTDGSATGNCAADPGADTICVDLLGETVEIGGGVAWDGQGSYEGSAVLLWGGGDSHNEPPTVTIQITEDLAPGDSVGCDVSPTAVVYTDSDTNQWWAIDDFEYYGASCTVTFDSFTLEEGGEISGRFTAEAVNGDYTADAMSGTFRATVIVW